MRITQKQLQLLTRYPRSTRVWNQLGVTLAATTKVVIQGNQVLLVRQAAPAAVVN